MDGSAITLRQAELWQRWHNRRRREAERQRRRFSRRLLMLGGASALLATAAVGRQPGRAGARDLPILGAYQSLMKETDLDATDVAPNDLREELPEEGQADYDALRDHLEGMNFSNWTMAPVHSGAGFQVAVVGDANTTQICVFNLDDGRYIPAPGTEPFKGSTVKGALFEGPAVVALVLAATDPEWQKAGVSNRDGLLPKRDIWRDPMAFGYPMEHPYWGETADGGSVAVGYGFDSATATDYLDVLSLKEDGEERFSNSYKLEDWR